MNRKLLALSLVLIPLAFSLVVTSASASAQIWWHDVGRDCGSDSQTNVIDLPPETYPFTQMKMASTITWIEHWVYNEIFDGSQNLNLNMKGTYKGNLYNDVWWWNNETQEWFYLGGWSQALSSVWGHNELIKMSGTQISISYTIMKEKFEMSLTNPLTNETYIYGYAVLRHMTTKWVNGELQFEKSWEFQKS
jgi:hypothetical protein